MRGAGWEPFALVAIGAFALMILMFVGVFCGDNPGKTSSSLLESEQFFGIEEANTLQVPIAVQGEVVTYGHQRVGCTTQCKGRLP